MTLSKETIKKLRILEKAILAQPQFYKQNSWVSAIEPCGTTCCIAGWVDFIFNGKKVHEARAKRLNSIDASAGSEEWEGVVQIGLGITYAQADRLTDPSVCWPSPFCDDYEEAKTPKQRAKVAAARIEYFIATGGEDYEG